MATKPVPDPAAISVETTAKKRWDPTRPFQRINSPSFDLNIELDGDGHAMGTRRPGDFPTSNFIDLIAVSEALRLTPAWTRTFTSQSDIRAKPRAHSGATDHAGEQEVYGQLMRSFQTWTDAPGFQWHKWYDWNLHFVPAKEWDWLRGDANKTPPAEKEGELAVTGQSLECEWDAGAFGDPPGPMFNDPKGTAGGKMGVDWAWPMTDDWCWAAGRSIYDGGHEFGQNPPQCRTELHPCKAVANVRREAFNFPEVGHFVAAHQFVFFTSRKGGVVEYDSIAPPGADDYEFLVDLPLQPDEFAPDTYRVGSTPDFPFNRLALRRLEPLVHFDFQTHQSAKGLKLPPDQLEQNFKPEVTIEIPDPSKPRERQARIKIPLKKLAQQRSDVESYGVIVTLGWEDPNKTQGKQVKKCVFNFDKLHVAEVPSALFGPGDVFSGDEWRFKACVNNRWFQWEFDGIFDEDNILFSEVNFDLKLPQPLVIHLHEDDFIRVHSHGADLELVDNPLKDDPNGNSRTTMFNRLQLLAECQRTGEDPATAVPGDDLSDLAILGIPFTILEAAASIPLVGDVVNLLTTLVGLSPSQLTGKIAPKVADWRKHIDIQPPRAKGAHVTQRVVARNTVKMLALTLGNTNNPLAICDAGRGFSDERKFNPLPVKGGSAPTPTEAELKAGKTLTLLGVALREDGALAELFEPNVRALDTSTFTRNGPNRDLVNYELSYSVQVTPQFP